MTVLETLFDSAYGPGADPADAGEVLAFLLMPAEAFTPERDPDALAAVGRVLAPAKEHALHQWRIAEAARRSS